MRKTRGAGVARGTGVTDRHAAGHARPASPRVEILSEWARKRVALTLAYLEWLAETARLDATTLTALERVYPGVTAYARRGAPLVDCRSADLTALAARAELLLDAPDLGPYARAISGQTEHVAPEARLLAAWIGRPVRTAS